jgi:hypothetical protein
MFPEESQIKVVRFEPTQEELDDFESRIYEFLEEVNELERMLRGNHN